MFMLHNGELFAGTVENDEFVTIKSRELINPSEENTFFMDGAVWTVDPSYRHRITLEVRYPINGTLAETEKGTLRLSAQISERDPELIAWRKKNQFSFGHGSRGQKLGRD